MSYSKYYIYKRQYSDDNGATWHDVYPAETEPGGEPIGTYDTLVECEGSPGPTGGTKWVATFTGGTTASAACDSSSAITSGEVVTSGLASIAIGNCVTSIGEYAFYGCTSLSSVSIPDNVTGINWAAFRECDNLTSDIVLNNVTFIGGNAFRQCSKLTNVTIGNNITDIGENAFFNCNRLQSITILASNPPRLSRGVFDYTNDCPIYVPCSAVSAYRSASGWRGYYDGRIHGIPPCEEPTPTGGTKWFATFIGGTTASAACDGSTSISQYDVSSDKSIESIEIGDCVTRIVSYGFTSCNNLSSVTISDSVTTIDHYAFSYCTRLTSITVEATIPPALGSNVFKDTNICQIYVPCSAVSAYKSAYGWSDYASMIHGIPPCEEPTPTGGTKWVASFTGGTTASAECDSSSAITNGEVSSDVASIEIGGCVTSIGFNAFYQCTGLTSVTIQSGTTSIGVQAFERCYSLTGITIPDSVTSIGERAFCECSSLSSVTIPNSVTSIDDGTFGYCISLTSVNIPNSVTNIGGGVFYYCYHLTSVTIPSSVTSIDSYAFQYCSRLASVIVEATTPPSLGSSVFNNTNNCPIYVPSASVNDYKSASGWSTYASRIQAIT